MTGEESLQQVVLRAKRLNLNVDQLYLLAETQVDIIYPTHIGCGHKLW